MTTPLSNFTNITDSIKQIESIQTNKEFKRMSINNRCITMNVPFVKGEKTDTKTINYNYLTGSEWEFESKSKK